MRKRKGSVLFSARELVDHLECAHATTLALQDVKTLLARARDDDTLQFIQDKGFAHEEQFLEGIKSRGLQVLEMPPEGRPPSSASAVSEGD